MRLVAVACDACEVRVEGRFAQNEFAKLSADDLHFLRTFVNCEGRVRDMEAALGLSYPTVRARLTAFREKLSLLGSFPPGAAPPQPEARQPLQEPSSASDVLLRLKNREISFSEALELLKSRSVRDIHIPPRDEQGRGRS